MLHKERMMNFKFSKFSKYKKLDSPGIEPGTSSMLRTHHTTRPRAPVDCCDNHTRLYSTLFYLMN